MSDLPPRTHNAPKPPSPEEVNTYLKETNQDLLDRQKEILGGIERFMEKYPTIPDADVQAKAADFAGRGGAIAAFDKQVEARRVSEKQPYDRAAAAAQAFFKTTIMAPVEAGRTEIHARMKVFADKLAAEQRAQAQAAAEAAAKAAREAEAKALASLSSPAIEDAEAKAREAEAAAKQAAQRQTGRVVGSLGGSAGLRTTYKLNEETSDLIALARAVVAEAICQELVTLGKTLPSAAARGIHEAIKHLHSYGVAPADYLAFNSVRIGYAIRSEGVRQIPGCQIDEVRSI